MKKIRFELIDSNFHGERIISRHSSIRAGLIASGKPCQGGNCICGGASLRGIDEIAQAEIDKIGGIENSNLAYFWNEFRNWAAAVDAAMNVASGISCDSCARRQELCRHKSEEKLRAAIAKAEGRV